MSDKFNFAWPVTAEHADVFRHLKQKIDDLNEVLPQGRIVIFGAGIRGCSILKLLEKRGYSDIVFCDNNPKKQGNLIHEYNIISVEEAIGSSEKQVFLISPESSSAMGEQLTSLGLREDVDWFSFDYPLYDFYVKEYVRSVKDYLLIMGDCGISDVSMADSDDHSFSVGDMLKARYGEEHCKVLAMHGIGQNGNYHILRSLIDKGEPPAALVLLLVLESVTPKAHLMPRTQHPALLKKIISTLPDASEDFQEYAGLAQKRFDQFQVESFASFDKSKNEASEKLFMKMNYLFDIRENTEGISYLKKTIKMLNGLNIPVVLYIPPVNYEQGEKFFGEAFREKYKENFRNLFGFLDKENLDYSVVDTSFLLNKNQFAAPNTIDEGANYEGRVKIVEFINNSNMISNVFRV